MYDTVEHVLAADVAPAGTFTVGYPQNSDSGMYALGRNHFAQSHKYGRLGLNKMTYAFGTASITVTNGTGITLEAGTKVWFQFDRPGGPYREAPASPKKVVPAALMEVSLGAPDAAVSNGVVVSQAATALGGLATGINGSLASGGVATFDVPRAIVAAWTTNAVLTITGTDEFGAPLVESSAGGAATMTGKKAFKTVTGIKTSVDITGLTVGTGDVLGLPVFLSDIGRVFRELQDGVAATAGTLVKAVQTNPSTAVLGDVRGTYDPNAACDGAKAFTLFIAVDDPSYKGVPQFAG